MRNVLRWVPNWAYDLLFLFILSLIPLLWFPEGYMVTSQDAAYPINIQENFQSRFFTWSGVEPLGRDHSFDMGSVMIHGVEAAFSYGGLSHFDAQKLTFVFWFFMMLSAMYYFARSIKSIFPYRLFPLFASVLYGVNYYLLALWRHGAGTTFSAYTALPLIASFYLSVIMGEIKVVYGAAWIGLVLFLFNAGGGLSIPLFGGSMIVLGVATVYFPFVSNREDRVQVLRRIVGLVVATGIFTFVTNAYWILPLLSFGVINYHADIASQVVLSGARSWMDSVSGHTSMMNLFRLQGFPDWYDNMTHSYSNILLGNPLLVILSFFIGPLVYGPLYGTKGRKEKIFILFFVLISLVGLFFSAGTHPPLGFIMGWMVEHVPGFSIFRSAQYKFISAVYFSFALLISYTLSVCLHNIQFSRRLHGFSGKAVQFIVMTLLLVIIIGYHFPYFGREFFIWNKPLTLLLRVPDYVYSFKKWSDSHLSYDQRLLVLPKLNSVWNAEIYTWKYFATFSLLSMITDKPIIENLAASERTEPMLIARMYQELLKGDHSALLPKLTALFQTTYALMRGDSEHRLNWVPSEDPTLYSRALAYTVGATRVWADGAWSVYRLPMSQNYSGRIYSVPSVTLYAGDDKGVVGALIHNANNFVLDKDIRSSSMSDLRAKLPIHTRLFFAQCESCMLESDIVPPQTPQARILPGSVFYPLKAWKERRASLGLLPQDMLGNTLGLSAIRLTEMVNLIRLERSGTLIVQIAEQLVSYWDVIDASIVKKSSEQGQDFQLYQTIRSYTQHERATVLTLYNDFGNSAKYSGEVKQALGRLIVRLDLSRDVLDRYIPAQNWSMTKHFSMPQTESSMVEISIDAQSLGTPARMPTRLIVGNTAYDITPTRHDELVTLGSFPQNNATFFRLEFPEPPDVSVRKRANTDHYPIWSQKCVSVDIDDFSWRKKYKILLETKGETNVKQQLYVKKQKVTRDSTNALTSSVLAPDVQYNLDALADQKQKEFYLDSSEGDYGATVSYCMDASHDPMAALVGLKIEEVITPSVYIKPIDGRDTFTPVRPVQFIRGNPTRYELKNLDMTTPQILIVNERYNSGWRLYASSTAKNKQWPWTRDFWIDTPLYDTNHFRIFGFANAWYIDAPLVGDVSLGYFPQQLYYRGLVISGAGLLGIAVYISLRRRFKRHII